MDVLREIFVLLGMKTDDKSFEASMGKVEAFKKRAEQLTQTFKQVGEKLFDAFVETGKEAEGMLNLAQRTGVAAQTLQEFAAIAESAGLPQDAFATGLRGLALSMNKVSEGSDEAIQAFAKVGVRTRDASGKMRPLNDVLLDISDKFATMPDSGEKLALATALLGKQGGALIPILDKGSKALAEQQRHMRALGVVMSKDDLEAAAAFDDAMDDLGLSIKGIRNAIVGPLMKPLAKMVESFWKWNAASKEIIGSAVGRFLKMVGAAFYAANRVATPFIEAFVYFADTATGSKVLFAGFIAVLTALGAAFIATTASALGFVAAQIAAAAPILAVSAAVLALVSAIALLVEDFYVFSTNTKSRTLFGTLSKGFDELAEKIKNWFPIKFWKEQLTEFFAWLEQKTGAVSGAKKIAIPKPGQGLGANVEEWLMSPVHLFNQLTGSGPGASAPALNPSFKATFNITSPDPAQAGSSVREHMDDWFGGVVSRALGSTVGQYAPDEGGG